MKAPHVVLLSLVGLVALSACLDVNGPGVAAAQIRVVNATGQTVDLFVDDRLAVQGSEQLNISLLVTAAGPHVLSFRTAGDVFTTLSISTTPAGNATAYAYTNTDGALVAVLMDSTAVPAAGQSAVRVVNVSHLAGSVDVYGKQPVAAAAAQFVSPFNYLTTSPAMVKGAGDWEVYITPAGSTTPLRTTGSFAVEDRGRRTVFLIDSLNTPVLRIVLN